MHACSQTQTCGSFSASHGVQVGVNRCKAICYRPAPLQSQIQLTAQHIERLTSVKVANISQTHSIRHTHIHTPSQSRFTASYYQPLPFITLQISTDPCVIYYMFVLTSSTVMPSKSDVFIARGLRLPVEVQEPPSKTTRSNRTHQYQAEMDSSDVFRASMRAKKMQRPEKERKMKMRTSPNSHFTKPLLGNLALQFLQSHPIRPCTSKEEPGDDSRG